MEVLIHGVFVPLGLVSFLADRAEILAMRSPNSSELRFRLFIPNALNSEPSSPTAIFYNRIV